MGWLVVGGVVGVVVGVVIGVVVGVIVVVSVVVVFSVIGVVVVVLWWFWTVHSSACIATTANSCNPPSVHSNIDVQP